MPHPDSLHYGLDVGGTKIELVACDAKFDVRYKRRIATPSHDFDAFATGIDELLREADAELGSAEAALGIGVPGFADLDGRHLTSNVPALNGRRVAAELRQRLGRPVFVGNDCQCFALGEANGGAAQDKASMFGAIIGTGVGGGYCVDGRLISGFNGLAGEWGHQGAPASLLEKHGLPVIDCPCGLRGCVERYISGSGLNALHRLLGGDGADAQTLAARADAGDAVAQRTLDIHVDLLGHALADLVKVLDPHVIVLGGGLSKLERLYRQLPDATAAHLFRNARVPPILPPVFGDAGGARGAAVLARQHGY